MLLHKLRTRARSEDGFTLIELLVVVLIIGILAAIALPSFLNQRGKAQDSEAKSAARTAQTAMETYFTYNQTYNTNWAGLVTIEAALANAPAGSAGADAPTASGTPDSYEVRVYSKDSSRWFQIARTNTGVVNRTCGPAAQQGQGGCKANGTW
jgi:type IV pilus assembly protein PilA